MPITFPSLPPAFVIAAIADEVSRHFGLPPEACPVETIDSLSYEIASELEDEGFLAPGSGDSTDIDVVEGTDPWIFDGPDPGISPPALEQDPTHSPIDTETPKFAVAQKAAPRNRGARRVQASRAKEQSSLPEARAPPFSLDLARPETWPPLLRISDICRDPKRGYAGILPMTRSAFLAAVEDLYIARGIKLGGKVIAWRKEDILQIVQHGVVGRREQGRRAKAREAQRRAAAESAP